MLPGVVGGILALTGGMLKIFGTPASDVPTRRGKSVLPNSSKTANSITNSVYKVKEVNYCDLPHHDRIQDD